jgi:aspartokinase-like uncharacterized kinase
MLMAVSLRIIKLGGSLLDWDQLQPAFRRWLADQPAAKNALVVGGGRLADQVRHLDRLHNLDPTTIHFAAAITMSATARLVAALLGDLDIVTEVDELLPAGPAPGCVVFDAYSFLANEEARADGQNLPHGWQVTSDSIAARLAQVTRADELVLLKSALPPRGATWSDVVRRGLVDSFFPEAVMPVPHVRFVNLRDARTAEWQLPAR